MTLIRAVGRTLLASYFVASGIKAARTPAAYVDDAEPIAKKAMPVIQKYAPRQIAGLVPEDTTDLVRLNGVLQVVGGIALATGKGRRLGAIILGSTLVPSTLARHPFWSEHDPELRAVEKTQFLKNVSLLGGVILAARDTEGQPGLRWRAAAGAHALNKGGQKASKSLSRSSKALSKNAEHAVDAAVAGGLALASGVVKETRRSRKKAAKAAKKARKQAGRRGHQLLDDAAASTRKGRKQLAKQAEIRRRELAKQAEAARKAAIVQAEAARKAALKQSKGLRKDVGKQAERISSQVADTAADVRKSAEHTAADLRKTAEKTVERVGHNIERGLN